MRWWPRRKPKMIPCYRDDCMNHLEHPEGEHLLVDISETTQRARRKADKAIQCTYKDCLLQEHSDREHTTRY